MQQSPDMPPANAGQAAAESGAAVLPRPVAVRLPTWRDAVIRWSLILLWLFNLEDFVLTQAALRAGARESNLVVDYFLRWGFWPALAFKLSVITLGSLLLWRYRRHPATIVASTGLALAYLLVVIYHLAAGVA